MLVMARKATATETVYTVESTSIVETIDAIEADTTRPSSTNRVDVAGGRQDQDETSSTPSNQANGEEQAELAQSPQINHDESDHKQPSSKTNQIESTTRSINKNQVSTSYSLFSTNPNRFILDNIHSTVHYLTDKIEGRIWLDVNGDGKRGEDYTTPSENAIRDFSSSLSKEEEIDNEEYDLGIGGVQVHLIDCLTDQPHAITNLIANPVTSQPFSPYVENVVVKQSEEGTAGLFSFPIDQVESGRYYLMYTAPQDYRISGNVLPLDREEPYLDQFDCIPSGGEGDSYLQEAKRYGEFDMPGYCARSIGCFEVDRMQHAHAKTNFDDYSKLQVLEDNQALKNEMKKGYQTYMGSLAAVPFAEYFNVGLAQEEWDLPTYQYADLEVTLILPPDVDLERVLPQYFRRSNVRRQLEQGLRSFLTSDVITLGFDLQGIDLHSGRVRGLDEGYGKTVMEPTTRKMLRVSSPSATKKSQRETKVITRQVTYSLTARGHYRPPPYKQLGLVIEDSINSHPREVIRSLKMKVEALPDDIDIIGGDVYAEWLTMKEKQDPKPEPPMELKFNKEILETNDNTGNEESEVSVLVITLVCVLVLFCILIAGACLYRRSRNSSQSKMPPEDAVVQRDINFMSATDIMEELESYGVFTSKIASHHYLMNTLVQARLDNAYSKRKKKVSFSSFATVFGSIASGSKGPSLSSLSTWSKKSKSSKKDFGKHERKMETKREQMEEAKKVQMEGAIKSCESLSAGELIQMLKSLGVSASGIMDKKELVRALAEARVNGVKDDGNTTTATSVATEMSQSQHELSSRQLDDTIHSSGREGMRNSNARSGQRRSSTMPSPKMPRRQNPYAPQGSSPKAKPHVRSATTVPTQFVPPPRPRSRSAIQLRHEELNHQESRVWATPPGPAREKRHTFHGRDNYPPSMELNTSNHHPPEAFTNVRNESQYSSRHDRLAKQSDFEEERRRSNFAPIPESEELRRQANVYPSVARRMSEEHPRSRPDVNNGRPRSKRDRHNEPTGNGKKFSKSSNDISRVKSSRKNKSENTDGLSQSCHPAIDGLFKDNYSFDF